MGMLEKKPAGTNRKSLLKHAPGGVQVENQVDRETIIQDVKKGPAPKKRPPKRRPRSASLSPRVTL